MVVAQTLIKCEDKPVGMRSIRVRDVPALKHFEAQYAGQTYWYMKLPLLYKQKRHKVNAIGVYGPHAGKAVWINPAVVVEVV